jgi:hypothetical protein
MKERLEYPLDAFADAMTSVVSRVIALTGSVAVGLCIGSVLVNGAEFNWVSTFALLTWAAIAWIMFPSYLIANFITILALIIVLRTESTTALVPTCAVVGGAWAWLAYIWS